MPIPFEGIIPLGHDRGTFYYLSRAAGQVASLTASQHTKQNLMGLASVPTFWEKTRHVTEKGGIQWDGAADDLMCQCRDIGIYDPGKVRGRGTWIDNGRPVLHNGNRLILDGSSLQLMLPRAGMSMKPPPRLLRISRRRFRRRQRTSW